MLQFFHWDLHARATGLRAPCEHELPCRDTRFVLSDNGPGGYYTGVRLDPWCAPCFGALKDFVFRANFEDAINGDAFPHLESLRDSNTRRGLPVHEDFIREARASKPPRLAPKLTRALVFTMKDLASSLNVPEDLPDTLKQHRVCTKGPSDSDNCCCRVFPVRGAHPSHAMFQTPHIFHLCVYHPCIWSYKLAQTGSG